MAKAGGGPAAAAPAVRVEHVREPSASDTAALARLLPLLSSATPPDHASLRTIAGAPGTSLLFARLDGEVVGALTLITFHIPTGTRAIIEDVVVAEQARGHGVGAMLVAEALRIAADAGARNVDLTSRPSREAANRLYARSGFTQRETNVWRKSLDVPASDAEAPRS